MMVCGWCVFQMQGKIEDLETELRQSTERLDLLTREKEEVSDRLLLLCGCSVLFSSSTVWLYQW